MKTEIIHPRLVVIQYHQEPGDPDYGTCMWAEFTLNLDAYSLSIRSDCGTYGYTWSVTPCETFLHLCARFRGEQDYLLSKMSDRTVIDDDATFESIKYYLEESAVLLDNTLEMENIDKETFWDTLKRNARGANELDIVDAVRNTLEDYDIKSENVNDMELWECVEKCYPAGACRIVDVFVTHIVPILAEMAKEETNNAETRR